MDPGGLTDCLLAHPDGAILRLHAQPGARRDALVGIHGDALKLAVRAAPEKGRANTGIQKLLAAALGIAVRDVELLSGPAQRQKRFLLRGLTPEDAALRLMAAMADDG